MTSRSISLALYLCLTLNGCNSIPGFREPPSQQLSPVERSQRILRIEREIAGAREGLEALISAPEASETLALRDRPELAELAAQLASLSAELDALQTQSPGLGSPEARP